MKHSRHINDEEAELYNDFIRVIPDCPKPGVTFRDVAPLLKNSDALDDCIRMMSHQFDDIDYVVGIEARGFALAAALAFYNGCGFIAVRKAGKLHGPCDREDYMLEYGSAALELGLDSIEKGARVIVADDVLATGGTAAAAGRLVRRQGGIVLGFEFLISIEECNGARVLESEGVIYGNGGRPEVHALLTY